MKTILSIAWQSPVRYLFLAVSLIGLWMLRHSLAQALAGNLGASPWELLLLPFVAVVVGSGYAALAISLNTTYVESDASRALSVAGLTDITAGAGRGNTDGHARHLKRHKAKRALQSSG